MHDGAAELDSKLTSHSGPQDAKAGYSAKSSTNGIQHELASSDKGHGPHEMDGQNAVELDGSQPEPRDGGVRLESTQR